MTTLRDGEREAPNPGGKRCKVCGGLITEDTLIRYGCNIRHAGCVRGESKPKQAATKRCRKPVRNLSYLFEETP